MRFPELLRPKTQVRQKNRLRRPALCALEDRDCPAVTFAMDGHTLLIRGNGAADHVQISEFGNGFVRASIGDATPRDFNDVDRIDVNLGTRDDVVMLEQATARLRNMDIRVVLGTGNDRFFLAPIHLDEWGLPTEETVTSALYVSTGAGADAVTLSPALAPVTGKHQEHIFNVELGKGNDSLHASAFFAVNSALEALLDCSVTIKGEAGNEAIDLELGGPDTRDPAQVGDLLVHVDLGAGNNTFVHKYSHIVADALDWLAESGSGNDIIANATEDTSVNGDTSIRTNTGGGNDSLNFKIEDGSEGFGGSFEMGILFGDGVDQALIDISGTIAGQFNLAILGGASNDFVNAERVNFDSPFSPNIVLNGDAGNDSLIGTEEGDILHGGPGNDYVSGGPGNDIIDGENGHDQLFGADGADIIDGGDGNDYIAGGLDNDMIDGGSGDDQLFGADGSDDIHGGNGHDYISGATGNDALYGDAGDDEIYGADGNDNLDGGSGLDYLSGGTGNDWLDGGLNDLSIDHLVGGTGGDIFEETAPPCADVLVDFDPLDGDVTF
jgi:Ca2+-binding RTX toxin-like protein